MGRGGRILLGIWFVTNAVILAFLGLDLTREGCTTRALICLERPEPLVERGYVLAGAILANGAAVAGWVTTRPASN